MFFVVKKYIKEIVYENNKHILAELYNTKRK